MYGLPRPQQGELYGPPVANYTFEQPGTDVEVRGTIIPYVEGGDIRVGLPKTSHAPYEGVRRAFAPNKIQPSPQGLVSDEQLAESAVRQEFGIPQAVELGGSAAVGNIPSTVGRVLPGAIRGPVADIKKAFDDPARPPARDPFAPDVNAQGQFKQFTPEDEAIIDPLAQALRGTGAPETETFDAARFHPPSSRRH